MVDPNDKHRIRVRRCAEALKLETLDPFWEAVQKLHAEAHTKLRESDDIAQNKVLDALEEILAIPDKFSR